MHTIRVMRSLVENAKHSAPIIDAAVSIIYLTPQKDQLAEACAIFDYVRDSIRYVRDVFGTETLADPRTTLLRKVGDCDDQSTLLAALLEAVGYRTRFVVAGYSSTNYEHVYVQVFVRGQWFNCDPTEDKPFGWAPPMHRSIWFEKR